MMELMDVFYDEFENVKARFIGFTTGNHHYDFGIVYTDMFFGKLLIVCMQTRSSALLDSNDFKDPQLIQHFFELPSIDEAELVAHFFVDALPPESFYVQYD